MESGSRWQRTDLSRELEPGVLPRQLQALEQLSRRLAAERPTPSQRLRDELATGVEAPAGPVHLAHGTALALGLLLSGLGLLVLLALLAL
jgi:hypothetical protein